METSRFILRIVMRALPGTVPALLALLTFASAGVFAQNTMVGKGGDDRNGAYDAVPNW